MSKSASDVERRTVSEEALLLADVHLSILFEFVNHRWRDFLARIKIRKLRIFEAKLLAGLRHELIECLRNYYQLAEMSKQNQRRRGAAHLSFARLDIVNKKLNTGHPSALSLAVVQVQVLDAASRRARRRSNRRVGNYLKSLCVVSCGRGGKGTFTIRSRRPRRAGGTHRMPQPGKGQ